MKPNLELNLQITIIQYLRFNKLLVFSVPNGTNIKNPRTRKLNRLSGCLAGVSDLVVVTKKQPYFIEIKANKGKQQPSQEDFQEEIEKLGYTYLVWRSIEDAEKFVKDIK